jgi:hypothetical protein
MEDPLLAVDDQRVAGVVAALEPDDHLCALGQQIDQLALAFVTPLRTDNRCDRHLELLGTLMPEGENVAWISPAADRVNAPGQPFALSMKRP